MTSNQISYWRNVETERSNRRNEDLTRGRNQIARDEASEKARANRKNEQFRAIEDSLKVVDSYNKNKNDETKNFVGLLKIFA